MAEKTTAVNNKVDDSYANEPKCVGRKRKMLLSRNVIDVNTLEIDNRFNFWNENKDSALASAKKPVNIY